MDHLHKPWRVLEGMRLLRGKYGENTRLLANHEPQRVVEQREHSFPELIGKHYTVVHLPASMLRTEAALTSYRISEDDVKRQAARRKREKELSLDNDTGEI